MSRKYKFKNPNGIYFVSFATVNWIDVFTRPVYKDILVENLNYCVENKGLVIWAWVIMPNHLHLLIGSATNNCADILRDFKRVTAKAILRTIAENPQESRKEWMLSMFEQAGRANPNNTKYQFWQQHNQPIDVSMDANKMERAVNYIHDNPVRSGFVNMAEHYPYSSAVDYADSKGMVKIEKIYE